MSKNNNFIIITKELNINEQNIQFINNEIQRLLNLEIEVMLHYNEKTMALTRFYDGEIFWKTDQDATGVNIHNGMSDSELCHKLPKTKIFKPQRTTLKELRK